MELHPLVTTGTTPTVLCCYISRERRDPKHVRNIMTVLLPRTHDLSWLTHWSEPAMLKLTNQQWPCDGAQPSVSVGHRKCSLQIFYWSSCVNTDTVGCLTRCRCFSGNPTRTFKRRLELLQSPQAEVTLAVQPSQQPLLCLWATFTERVTMVLHADVQTDRNAIVLGQKWSTCLLWSPPPSHRPVTAESVVSVGWLHVGCFPSACGVCSHWALTWGQFQTVCVCVPRQRSFTSQ